jgi:hypothetical protein
MAQIRSSKIHNEIEAELASCEPRVKPPTVDGKDKSKQSRHGKRTPTVDFAVDSVENANPAAKPESTVDNPVAKTQEILKDICFEIKSSPGGLFILTCGYPEKSHLMAGKELAERLLIMLSQCPVHICSKKVRVVEVGYTITDNGLKRWFVRINDNVYEVLMLDYRDSVINIKYQDWKTGEEKEIAVYPKKATFPITPEAKIVSNKLEHGLYRLWRYGLHELKPLSPKPLDSTTFLLMDFNGRILMRRCYYNHSDNSHSGFQYYLVRILSTEEFVVAGRFGKKDSIKKKLTVEIIERGIENGEPLIASRIIELYEVYEL